VVLAVAVTQGRPLPHTIHDEEERCTQVFAHTEAWCSLQVQNTIEAAQSSPTAIELSVPTHPEIEVASAMLESLLTA